MPYVILAAIFAFIVGVSLANDQYIENHGGETTYFWEKDSSE